MRNVVRKSWGSALTGVAGIAAAAAAAMLSLPISEVAAGGDAVGRRLAIGNGGLASSGHQSLMRVKESDLGSASRQITLGRNKSTLIEMPRELRDVIVSNPELVDAVVQTSNRVYLIGKKVGQANAFFFDTNGEQILTLEIAVEVDTAVLDTMFRRLLPGSNIKSEMLNETIILTGSVRNPVDSNRASDLASRFMSTSNPSGDDRPIKKVVNMLAVEGEEQVMLRVTVAEVQRSLLKQFGINIGASIRSGNFSTNLLTENALPLTAARGLGTLPVPALGTAGLAAGATATCLTAGVLCNFNQGPVEGTFGNSGLNGGWDSNGPGRISQALRMLERNGLVRTLAEPNLTAVSGETAKFLAGGEYPVPVVDSQGALNVTFKEFGIGLAFTPIVMSEGRISLKIETEVSELTNTGAVSLSNISIPALKKRQAKSTVELPSGGSLALAGLISEDLRQNIDGLPGLKDLPVLGTLFRSRDFIKEETELVIIVTPYAVRPTARGNLARPDDGLAAATDMKANFLGHLNRVYGKGAAVPDGGLKGNYGFIVE
jgi:pilus assembly protein CpaC